MLAVSFYLPAADKKKQALSPYSNFNVTPLNSPVSSTIKFLITTPDEIDVNEVYYKVRNAGKIFEKTKDFERINLLNKKELHLNVSRLPTGFYQLFIKIKDKNLKEHFYKTQHKNHVQFTIENQFKILTPDSELNSKNIQGIDSDYDGIRDDIQIWINTTFSANPNLKMAMLQLATARQLNILNVKNKERSILSSHKYLDSLLCLSLIIGIDKKSQLNRELESKLLNTKDRLYADIKSNANFSGESYDLPRDEERPALCDFKPSNISKN